MLVICEDPTHDQYIVKPVVQAIFDGLGRRIRLEVLPDPHLRGINDVFDHLTAIISDNPMIDLFVVIVDRDCDRQENTRRLQNKVAGLAKVVVCLAVEEVEAWMLCLHRDSLGEPWNTVRADCDVKEHFAEPLLERLALGGPGRGRKAAMRDLGPQWRSLLQFCPEVSDLASRVRTLASPAT